MVPYKDFSKNSYRSSSSVDPQKPPIASTRSAIPVKFLTRSFSGSNLATFLKADPSTRRAALGASCSRCSLGQSNARNFNFCTYSWTLVDPGMNFGMLFQGGCGPPVGLASSMSSEVKPGISKLQKTANQGWALSRPWISLLSCGYPVAGAATLRYQCKRYHRNGSTLSIEISKGKWNAFSS